MNTAGIFYAGLCVRLTAALGHFLWQAAAVAAAALVAARLLRRSSAQLRYAVLLAALLVMAACPPVTFLLVAAPATATTTGMPGLQTPGQVPRAAFDAPASPTPPPPGGMEAVTSGGMPTGAPPPPEAVVATDHTPLTVSSADSARPEPPPAAAANGDRLRRFAPHVTAAYLLGVGLMLVRLLLALRGGMRLRGEATPLTDTEIIEPLARQARRIGLRFIPAAARCARVAAPTVVGVLRPTILLPVSLATGLSSEQIEAILAHELAHIRRWDHLVNLLQRIIEALLFFHPAIWLISRRIRIERENCCDDIAVAASGKRQTYAAALVQLAEASLAARRPSRLASAAALGAADKPSRLRSRIIRLLEGPAQEKLRLLRSWPLAAVLAACLVVPISIIKATAPDKPTASPKEWVKESARPRAPAPLKVPALVNEKLLLTETEQVRFDVDEHMMRLSPDAKRLLYVRRETVPGPRRPRTGYRLYLRDLASGKDRPLPVPAFEGPDPLQVMLAMFDPSGRKIAVAAGIDDNRNGVYDSYGGRAEKGQPAVYDVATGKLTRLEPADEIVVPVFDRTGKRLIVYTANGGQNLSVADLGGSEPRRLGLAGVPRTPCPTADVIPLAVLGHTARGGHFLRRLALFDLRAEREVAVLKTGTDSGRVIVESALQWTVDGRYLYYTDRRNDKHKRRYTRVWDRWTGREAAVVTGTIPIGPGPTKTTMVLFDRFARGPDRVRLHDAATGKSWPLGGQDQGMRPICTQGKFLVYSKRTPRLGAYAAEITPPAGASSKGAGTQPAPALSPSALESPESMYGLANLLTVGAGLREKAREVTVGWTGGKAEVPGPVVLPDFTGTTEWRQWKAKRGVARLTIRNKSGFEYIVDVHGWTGKTKNNAPEPDISGMVVNRPDGTKAAIVRYANGEPTAWSYIAPDGTILLHVECTGKASNRRMASVKFRGVDGLERQWFLNSEGIVRLEQTKIAGRDRPTQQVPPERLQALASKRPPATRPSAKDAAKLFGLVPPVDVKGVSYYLDGGTTGIILADAKGGEYPLCLDGRESQPWPRHVFTGATYPTRPGAKRQPIGGKAERALTALLRAWADRRADAARRAALLKRRTVAGLSEPDLRLLRVLRVVATLSSRSKAAGDGARTQPTDAREAAASSQPATRARETPAEVRAAARCRKKFLLNVHYTIPRSAALPRGKSGTLVLSNYPGIHRPPDWVFVRIDERQINAVVDFLLEDGFFARAIDLSKTTVAPIKGPACTLSVSGHGAGRVAMFYEDLGWGPKILRRLGGLRKVLDGDAGKAMDKLLKGLAPYLRRWRNAPARSGPPQTQPDAAKAKSAALRRMPAGLEVAFAHAIMDASPGRPAGGATASRPASLRGECREKTIHPL